MLRCISKIILITQSEKEQSVQRNVKRFFTRGKLMSESVKDLREQIDSLFNIVQVLSDRVDELVGWLNDASDEINHIECVIEWKDYASPTLVGNTKTLGERVFLTRYMAVCCDELLKDGQGQD